MHKQVELITQQKNASEAEVNNLNLEVKDLKFKLLQEQTAARDTKVLFTTTIIKMIKVVSPAIQLAETNLI